MVSITENEEKQLDKGYLQINKDNQIFNINSNEIICYGEIDFNTNSEDYITIEEMKWLDYLEAKGLCIPSNYNYATHSCTTSNKKAGWTETFNPAVISQYVHARLGKPERVCIFKEKRNAKRT